MTNGQNGKSNIDALNIQVVKQSKKFLFVSWESLSGDLAWQIKKEGNDVKD